ncbi:MAG TPA: amino acid adenylation domain-containing protein [Gemmatimonas sp.]|uniref:non-ribosomal peptide synthetase/type I polyketide synthase n=1 Tax=Gemmatimonas sp. TaxID=1962908 RepID=UPI002ED9EFCB
MDQARDEASPLSTDDLSTAPDTLDGVAVVGMSMRVPGADSPEQFWQNLVQGIESLDRFTDDELRGTGMSEERLADPGFVKVRGLFSDPEAFDAAFFGYSVREAELMDPQQRVFLETCWNALEHSGHAPGRVAGIVGVWGGQSTGMENNTYLLSNLHGNPSASAPEDALPKMLGNANDYLATRVSHRMDLRGPSMNVQSACSTSLVAIAQAYQSLMTYGCDMALAGGVAVSYPQKDGYDFQEGGIGSPDGHCRPFDAKAAGTVFSNGVGVVALKRLDDALADGDQVYAVIRGAAMNNDGAAKMSFAAPSVEGQAQVIASAQAMAGVSPDSIGYVECHGTATPIGDPIEVAALTRAFALGTTRRQFCALGSVKSNIGHLDSAAGVTGFIKAVLSLHHRQIPPTLHFEKPNPAIDFTNSPFFVADRLREWTPTDSPRRAGVSAFGIGGTNVHIVLEEAPQDVCATPIAGHSETQLLPLATKTASALDAAALRLADHLATNDAALSDMAFTLQEGREPFRHRQVVMADAAAAATTALRRGDRQTVARAQVLSSGGRVAFLYPGGGTQYLDMGRDLYREFPVAREWMDRGLNTYRARTGVDLRATWFADAADHDAARLAFERPSLQLPAIFILQVAITRLWMSWGIQPDALLGHSLGENTAAHIAGVLSYDDALGLVILRGQLFERVTPGGMLSVACSAADAQRYLSPQVDLATINGAAQCTLSGDQDALRQLAHRLDGDGVEHQIIPIAIAAHSHLLDPILGDFRAYLQRITLSAPTLPIVSNRSGQWLTDVEARDPEYWVGHLRNTVRFADGLSLLASVEERVFVECGPGKVLSSLARLEGQTPAERIVASTRHAEEYVRDTDAMRFAAARLWTLGAPLDWQAVRSATGTVPAARRVPMPTYPFARTRYLITPTHRANGAPVNALPEFPGVAMAAVPNHTIAMDAVVHPAPPETRGPVARRSYIQDRLQHIISEMSGMTLADVDVQETFLNMGFDSLFLTQANLRFKKEFKVKITFRQLFDAAPSIAALAGYIDRELPLDALQTELSATSASVAPVVGDAIAPVLPSVATPIAGGAMSSPLQQAIALQIQANTALLTALQAQGTIAAPVATAASPTTVVPSAPRRPEFKPTVTRPAATGRFGPFKPVQKNLAEALSPAQEQYLADFIQRVIDKTPSSKAYTAQHRAHFADPRAVSGFKQVWKEITYPIVGDRSKGALVWDIDGNEYVDCAGGFGATFFGHAPDFLLDAVRAQMERSIDYAPQSPLAGPTARLICDLTGHERAAFCNTGSEAVLAAMRMARTVTGNDTIVSFYGSYHGMFDEVLVRPQEINGERVNKPVAPGIPESSNQNMVVLEYGDAASLRYIESIADELAAVIVEPIQSRNPELQPVAFVRELRALTERLGIPLIFDEIITGFRVHPRGAQGWYGVDADLCAYGKVVGGGMPVGVVAGRAQYMDALDGGGWQYGDESFPEAGVTYFAGTFVRHPTALAAVNAAMTRMTEAGPELQAALNRRTAMFCEQVNRSYHAMGVPVELTYFASVILPRWYGNPDFESLFFHHLRFHGAHIWEGRPGFFSVEHTDAHFARLHESFVAAASDLQRAGFLPVADAQVDERRDFSPAQRELWLALAMGPDARAAYNEQVLFEFATDLDADVLELTLDKVVNRHASLRSVVHDDEQGMRVRHYMAPTFAVVDLSAMAEADAAAEARRLAGAHIDAAFDLHHGPLVRLMVIRLAPGRTWLALAASHLVCDGWSLEVIMQDIAHFYEAMRTGRQVDRGTPPALTDFARALEEKVSGGEVADAEAYWLGQYREVPEPVNLPFDHARPPIKTYRGERQLFHIDAATADQLRAFAKAQGCTLFVATLTAYELLLHKLSGCRDLVIGIPAAGQPGLGLPGLVAHDVSFLPLRDQIDPTKAVRSMLDEVRRNFTDAQGSQDFAYGDLLQKIRPRRDPSRMPLLTAAFNMDLEMSPLHLGGTRGMFVTTPRGYVKYDLFFNLVDLGAGRGLDLEVDHNADLMEAATATHWASLYRDLLANLPQHAETLIGDLPVGGTGILAPALSGQDTGAATSTDTLVSLFEEAVDRYGDRDAVLFEGESLTYRELDAQANQMAHWLRAEGIRPDDVVALLFERSLPMVAAMYGTLKAGGAYLPLDTSHPAARLKEILTSAAPRVVLCTQGELPKLAAYVPAGVEVRAIDAPEAGWRTQSTARPTPAAAPDHLAYVIYTSGSTGMPKGVMNSHRGIASRLRWAQRQLGLSTTDVVLQKTPYTFDVSVWEFFWPLQVGAKLVLAAPGGHREPRYLKEVVREQGVTVMHFVPSMLGAFLSEPGVSALSSLRMVLCSGEALGVAHRDRLHDLWPNVRLVNLYGPTEAAVDVTWWECALDDHSSPIPIGWSVDDTQLYVLDATGRPVPRGAQGELYIAGVQVARGYLNDPVRTDERFVSLQNGTRAYRTGDLVRQRLDGALEFLGRSDSQVKVRGFRIELGDIEAKLQEIPGVQACAVLVAHEGADDDRLVAFIEAVPGTVVSQLKLRRELASRLPDYMLPQVFTVMERLPLNASGKIDRRALTTVLDGSSATTAFRAPSTAAEQRVAEIWQNALKTDRVSADAYFFDLGGHSLLAMSVSREMEAALGRRFDLREMLMSNLSQLAALVDSLASQVAG